MDDERLDALFEEALTVPAPERVRWLDVRCGNGTDLRRALERLLKADGRAEGVLERAPQLLAEVMADAVDVPARFGIWRVTGAIGAGGMGEVWLAERDDGQFQQRAAIKQVAWPTPGLLRRFREERQILARLEHPGIARLIDGGMGENGCPWLAMEYVEGVPITQWVREHTLSVRGTIDLVLQICDAVQFAHRNLVVHSDIKPSNILVSEGVPKLLDFGIAKVLSQDDSERTRTVAQLLTPDYAAPELLAGGTITTSVDVYALGVLLYQLLSGSKPYRVSVLAVAASLSDANIKPPGASVNSALPDAKTRRRVLCGDLDRIVMKAMAHEPAQRYATAEALATDLRNWLAGRTISARGQGRWYRAGKFVARHRVGFAATLLSFAILLAATIYSLREARLAEAQAARANAVRDFVVNVFNQTDPEERQGKAITAHELLDRGNRQLTHGSIGSGASRTEMQGLIGHLYWRIGDYRTGISLIEDAAQHPQPATPPDVRARNVLYLAQIELQRSLFATARQHAMQAQMLASQAGDAGAATLSDARRVYAASLIEDGNARAAEPILRQALAEDRARFGERSEAAAGDLDEIASATQGSFEDSISYSNQAIAIATALHGRASNEVIGDLETREATETYAGDPLSAERDGREAAALAAKLYGPTHVATLVARANLYMIYGLDERYAQALSGHLDVLRLIRPFAEFRPEQVAYEWSGVAVDYLGMGRYNDALQAARQSMAAWARTRSPDPEHASNDSRTVLAEILTAMGRLDEAAAAFRDAIRIEGKNAPPDSDILNRDLAYLGNVYRLQHRYADAVAITTRALHALSPKLGPTQRHAMIELMLAQAQLDAGDVAAAQVTAAQAEQIASIAYQRQPLAFSRFQYATASVALMRGNPAQAERLLRRLSSVRKTLPADDYRTVEVQVALIRALEMQGKRDDAKVLRAQVEPVLAASRSPYFVDLGKSLRQH